MPIPRAVARSNRVVLNPVIKRVAGSVPPLLLLRHVGRTSGRRFTTPLMAFPTAEGFIIALTYGPGTDWLRNLEATGQAEARYRRREYVVSAPRLVNGDPDGQPLPFLVRGALRLIGVRDFLYVTSRPARN